MSATNKERIEMAIGSRSASQLPAARHGKCAHALIQLPVVYVIKSSLSLDQELKIILNRFGRRLPLARDREPAADQLMDMPGLPDPQEPCQGRWSAAVPGEARFVKKEYGSSAESMDGFRFRQLAKSMI
jgi:hypothetical protein